ncbi:DNA internalization-related competence protein ComEC/Rec2 [Desulfuribacillus stibiiarsenatis]|uniref:DNA internalization-related competence protein ComEC/Rec2 n=1 Tax=Desulfuribacillus stibiiarsenatis TaxID=1390249 RepID=A0A1E5L7J7_9FIRM|nr:DNA internalization-related competence protein ComEC/Rec2 [Desulfuribacillus stibiiarsenatis]OEH86127.1 DNA internalization-related competence protein ComEC/Rec2 [Desulfuribacillus stibiiarsenatis]
MRRPLFWSLLIFITGLFLSVAILDAYAFSNTSLIIKKITQLVFILLIVILSSIVAVNHFKLSKQTFISILLSVFIFLLGSFYGLVTVKQTSSIGSVLKDRQDITMEGIVDTTWHTPTQQNIIIETLEKHRIRVILYKNDEATESMSGDPKPSTSVSIYPGDYVQVSGEFRKVEPKRNPGGFDERRYYWLHDWDGKVVSDSSNVKIIQRIDVSSSPTSSLSTYLFSYLPFKMREFYQGALRSHLGEKEFMIVNALILGERTSMDFDTKELIRKLGLAHLFAISGLHVGIIVLAFIAVMDRLRMVRERSYLILIILLPIYALLTGGTSSVVRAVIMIEVALLGSLLSRKSDVYTNIVIAAFLLSFYNPKVLLQVGFQLTFIITLGILLFEPIIDYLLLKWNFTWKWLRKLLSVTISAQVFSFPLLVYYFQEFSWTVLLSQYFILPITSVVILPIGFLFLLISWIHPMIPALLAIILQWASSAMLWITEFMSFATKYVSYFPERHWLWLVGYLLLALFLAYLMYQRRYLNKLIISLVCALLLFAGSLWIPKLPTGSLQMTLIDVGQGDAIHIETPKGRHILIDGGGVPSYNNNVYDVGERILLPYFRANGIRKLDMVFLSHADWDHIQGLYQILKEIPVQSFVYSFEDPRESFLQLKSIAEQKNIQIFQVSQGNQIVIEDQIVLDILYPDIIVGSQTDPNHLSMVMRLMYNEMDILLTGDIDELAEDKIRPFLQNSEIELLKAAHHGSQTSSSKAFLDTIQPKVSAISVGANNRFGHPNQSVIDRLEEVGSAIYRTDLHGAITFKLNKQRMAVETMIQLQEH